MGQNIRFFKLDTEWNAIHIPERPNGFGVFIIGDIHHFVDEHTSFWIQNAGENQSITNLLEQGYTVFYSNLYGKNWGSPKAVKLAKLLCHIVLKNEILNDRLHILATGMGALVAVQLLSIMEVRVRSLALINPCLDLKAYSQNEKEFKLFYKRFINEVSSAYEIKKEHVEEKLSEWSFRKFFFPSVPIKVWQPIEKSAYPYHLNTKKLIEERKKRNLPTSVTFHLTDKKYGIIQSIYHFFQEHEQL